ncbi:AAA ATPase [Ophidiomyces ophidiicola]|uniref:AAA ATPase n=1 Tax=Ophidiomyces ophidiicola TaxID=1387563 RepID=UPI0020C44992|nr:AAA ATPase [Ophidiomyces ophidiicola]KAI1946093.1 AAA ATPase [Ophidiomyces ophidiicola]KAI2057481.1 AAA ATPase [Ophidiomyces ophidiicola]
MAPPVLGKRQRNTAEPNDSTLSSPRKRRAAQVPRIHQDERAVPLSLPTRERRSKRVQNAGPQDVSEVKRPRLAVPCKGLEPAKASENSSTLEKSKESVTGQSKSLAEHDPKTDLELDENADPAPQFSTPRSKRFRDVSSFSPITPRHRVLVASKPVTPRTPRTITSVSARTVYTSARQLFARSATPARLVGRESERQELTKFINDSISSGRGGCKYVSGPPGTGKSALVEEVCREIQKENSAKVAYVNCASMTSARDIYGKLVENLCGDSQVFKKSEVERLRGMFLPKKNSGKGVYVVALDEIDHLLTSDLEILYAFFEWSMQANSRLVLVGIANALDLTDRFLPRLKSKNLKPQLLPFLPYTPTQITTVITTRLRSLLVEDMAVAKDFVPFLHPAAIQLCARKVASQSGDLRKAFDLTRRTIELIEREVSEKAQAASKLPLVENTNLAAPASPPDTPSQNDIYSYTAATAPRATVAHVARITSATFGNGTTERLQGLNLHQKATLCSLIAFGRKKRASTSFINTPTKSPKSTAPTVKELFDTYCSLCRKENVLQPLTSTEFKDIISGLETMGLIGEARTRGSRSGASGSGIFRTPTRSGRGATGTPSRKGGEESGLVCFVGEKEIEAQVTGPGEGVLKALLRERDA